MIWVREETNSVARFLWEKSGVLRRRRREMNFRNYLNGVSIGNDDGIRG